MSETNSYETLIGIIEEKSMKNHELEKENYELKIDNARLKNELEGRLHEVRNLRSKPKNVCLDDEDEDNDD